MSGSSLLTEYTDFYDTHAYVYMSIDLVGSSYT